MDTPKTIKFPKKIYNLKNLDAGNRGINSSNLSSNSEITGNGIIANDATVNGLNIGQTQVLPFLDTETGVGLDASKVKITNGGLEENASIIINTPSIKGNMDVENTNIDKALIVNSSANVNTMLARNKLETKGTISTHTGPTSINFDSNVDISTKKNIKFNELTGDQISVTNMKGTTLNSDQSIESDQLNLNTISSKTANAPVSFQSQANTSKLINSNNIDIYGQATVDGTVAAGKICNPDQSKCYTISEMSDVLMTARNSGNVKNQPMPDYKYYGCYKKKDFSRKNGPSTKKRAYDKKYTPESCNTNCAGYNYFGLFKNGKCYCAFEPDITNTMNVYSPDKCRRESDGQLVGNKKFVALYNRSDEDYDYTKEFTGELDQKDKDPGDDITIVPNQEFGNLKMDEIYDALQSANERAEVQGGDFVPEITIRPQIDFPNIRDPIASLNQLENQAQSKKKKKKNKNKPFKLF